MEGPKKAASLCQCGCGDQQAGKAPCCGTAGEIEKTPIRTATSEITFSNRLDHFLARWGVNRMGHIVAPGLYRLGNPTPDSDVFVSANYSLSFDALRSALAGRDAYILVLDTKGINVWCAAGKGTFGSDELVRRIASTDLANIVTHRRLILPQLSAPGVSWPDVVRRSGFLVGYGPVRARDLPGYLKDHRTTPAMRQVEFPLRDRVVLIPVELVTAFKFMVIPAIALGFLVSWFIAAELCTCGTRRYGPLPDPPPVAADEGFQHEGAHPRLPGDAPPRGPGSRRLCPPPAGMGGSDTPHLPADHRVPRPEFYRIDHLHLQDRCEKRDLPGTSRSWRSWRAPGPSSR